MANINKLKAQSKEPSALMAGGSKEMVNPWKQEIWRVYYKDKLVYNKEKTFANCWLKYKCVDYRQGWHDGASRINMIYATNTTNANNLPEKFSLPMIEDIDSYLNNENYMTVIHKETVDKLVITKLREFYSTTGIKFPINNYQFGTLWNTAGDLGPTNKNWTIKVDMEGNNGTQIMYFFKGTNVEEVTFNFAQGNIRSWDGVFQDCKNLRSIKVLYNNTNNIPQEGVLDIIPGSTGIAGVGMIGCQPVSVSRLFRGCNISSPGCGLENFNWKHCREFFSAFNGAVNLTYIPASLGASDFEEVNYNTMVPNSGPWDIYSGDQPNWAKNKSFGVQDAIYGSAHEMFSWTPNLQKIGPVIDCTYLIAGWSTQNMFYSPNLTQVRLKNLSNGVWKFDNSEGGDNWLPLLDKPSIDYLFTNLVDLANGYQEGEAYRTFIVTNRGELWCPEQWRDKITPSMIQSAKEKGWSIYINKQIQ